MFPQILLQLITSQSIKDTFWFHTNTSVRMACVWIWGLKKWARGWRQHAVGETGAWHASAPCLVAVMATLLPILISNNVPEEAEKTTQALGTLTPIVGDPKRVSGPWLKPDLALIHSVIREVNQKTERRFFSVSDNLLLR